MTEDQANASTPTVDWGALRDLVTADDTSESRRRRTIAVILAVVAWVAAFITLWVTWDQIASRSNVADQLPWFASGGLATIVLAIIGAACLIVAYLPAGGSSKPTGE